MAFETSVTQEESVSHLSREQLESLIDGLQVRYQDALDRLGVKRAGELVDMNDVNQEDVHALLEVLHQLQEAIDERDEQQAVIKREWGNPISSRYEELMDERKELDERLSELRLPDRSIEILSEKDPKRIEHIASQWMNRVRRDTNYFDVTDELGIALFSDDLSHHHGFPDVHVQFSSEFIRHFQQITGAEAGGYAQSDISQVAIKYPKPSLEQQLAEFVTHGSIRDEVIVLVHELIHMHNYRSARVRGIESVATEAHAYFSLIMNQGARNGFTLSSIIRILTVPKEHGGLYGIDVNLAIEAVRGIASLYALGYPGRRISSITADCRVVETDGEKHVEPLHTNIPQIIDDRYMDDIDLQALDDILRLRFANDRKKAQILLHETIRDSYPSDEEETTWERRKKLRVTYPMTGFLEPADKAVLYRPTDDGEDLKELVIEEDPAEFVRMFDVDGDMDSETFLEKAIPIIDQWTYHGMRTFLDVFGTQKYMLSETIQGLITYMREHRREDFVRAVRFSIGERLCASISYTLGLLQMTKGLDENQEDYIIRMFNSDVALIDWNIRKAEKMMGLTLEDMTPDGARLREELERLMSERGILKQ